MAFDQNFEEGSQPELLQRFQEFTIAEYAAGRRTALVVDEAQNISADDLESLRLLSNVNADGDVLLLMFLFGQPELRERLVDPKFRQISQRVGSDFHLSAMTEEETADYVRYLLEQAGAKYDVFDEQALRVVHETTSGIPTLRASIGRHNTKLHTLPFRRVSQGRVQSLWSPEKLAVGRLR